MDNNSLELLEHGQIDFLDDLLMHQCDNLAKLIRKNSNRNKIISGCLKKLIRKKPLFCFNIIYDIEEYKEYTFKLLRSYEIYLSLIKSPEKISDILNNTEFGKEFVLNNLNQIIAYEPVLFVILDFAFSSFERNQDIIKFLSLHKNLHVRSIFMEYLVSEHSDKLHLVYDDIMKYLTSYTHQEFEQLTLFPEKMQEKDISELAIYMFNSKIDKSFYYRLKEYILENYPSNHLASELINHTPSSKAEFISDADRLFRTSTDYKLEIYRKYSNHVSHTLIKDLEKYIKFFKRNNGTLGADVDNIFLAGLWNELSEYVDKYLSLSKSSDYSYLDKGTTAVCYKIGDYVFKLSHNKYSFEQVPNLYLIIKNLEEHYIRDRDGDFIAGIEIQKYLQKDATIDHVKKFKQELTNLGFGYYDTCTVNNFKLLDSYQDADHPNPELLPEWFKKEPVVLIDRDHVKKLKR